MFHQSLLVLYIDSWKLNLCHRPNQIYRKTLTFKLAFFSFCLIFPLEFILMAACWCIYSIVILDNMTHVCFLFILQVYIEKQNLFLLGFHSIETPNEIPQIFPQLGAMPKAYGKHIHTVQKAIRGKKRGHIGINTRVPIIENTKHENRQALEILTFARNVLKASPRIGSHNLRSCS